MVVNLILSGGGCKYTRISRSEYQISSKCHQMVKQMVLAKNNNSMMIFRVRGVSVMFIVRLAFSSLHAWYSTYGSTIPMIMMTHDDDDDDNPDWSLIDHWLIQCSDGSTDNTMMVSDGSTDNIEVQLAAIHGIGLTWIVHGTAIDIDKYCITKIKVYFITPQVRPLLVWFCSASPSSDQYDRS